MSEEGAKSSAKQLNIELQPGVDRDDLLAASTLRPGARHASLASSFGERLFNGEGAPFEASAKFLMGICEEVTRGDTSFSTDVLTSQALTLDTVFTELIRRAGNNMGEYPAAAETYMRLALKAQAGCRATLETLNKIQRGGEQVVRHIHVDNRGGQAVIAETVNTGGQIQNAADQPHAFTALLGEDPAGNGVPISSDAERPVPHARREVARCAEG